MSENPSIELTLDAVVVAVTDYEPRLLVVGGESPSPDTSPDPAALPSGPLDLADATLELGARRLIREQTGLEVGYSEQLYTFGDRDRRGRGGGHGRPISVAYLTLVQENPPLADAGWIGIYELFPWEDHREGRPRLLTQNLLPALDQWQVDKGTEARNRVQLAFGDPWDGIRVVERYELLYEAGLVQEQAIDQSGRPASTAGLALRHDHRRIASVALSRLRGKLTYRPLVFELLGDRFTLFELQRTVEALAGVPLHKQNFRRLVERSGLVERTGKRAKSKAGRPAELFRYRPEVTLERTRPGLGQPYR